MKIHGNGVLVTGAGSGLGEATARLLASRGARVVLADVDAERSAAVAAELGPENRSIWMDVADEASVTAAVLVAAEVGDDGLRAVVHCAGIAHGEPLLGPDGPAALEPFERVMRINVTGTFNVLRLAAAEMANTSPLDDGERGVIITTSSVAAEEGHDGASAYAGSKGAVSSFTLPAARDLAPYGIRVHSIAPGWFATPMTETRPGARAAPVDMIPFPPRTGKPEEYALLAAHIIENPMLNGGVTRIDGAGRFISREETLRAASVAPSVRSLEGPTSRCLPGCRSAD